MTRVDKPALLRRLFELGCRYSGQILSYTKMLGQLQDAGNTTTLAHYLELLAGAGMVTGLQKYAGRSVRQRGSSPKLQVLNTALMTAQSGLSPGEVLADREFRGRLVESAVGAHLANAAAGGACELFYWREQNQEVDFVVRAGHTVLAIEVKSGRAPDAFSGLAAFATATVLQRHYGWKIGVPAYALGSYVALARMSWNRHHATDVVMGAGLGIAAARTVTMTVGGSKFNMGVQPQVGGASVNFTKIYK